MSDLDELPIPDLLDRLIAHSQAAALRRAATDLAELDLEHPVPVGDICHYLRLLARDIAKEGKP